MWLSKEELTQRRLEEQTKRQRQARGQSGFGKKQKTTVQTPTTTEAKELTSGSEAPIAPQQPEGDIDSFPVSDTTRPQVSDWAPTDSGSKVEDVEYVPPPTRGGDETRRKVQVSEDDDYFKVQDLSRQVRKRKQYVPFNAKKFGNVGVSDHISAYLQCIRMVTE